ncbi:MAG TPA: DUF1028 domain-containing protein [Ignavibacteriaceae bacterium]|nr:DUF1028 domain-containing protein [Ignavibacteriaceae bacterium]
MFKIVITLVFAMFISYSLVAQDTFSIVAVDTVTGEIGSAGASCVGAINGVGAYILSDVIEGIGAIHTQASWDPVNQQNAHDKMLEGLSPQEIIDWLITNDVNNNPTIRQYGIVDLTRNGESAAYTGINCSDFKNHITGPGYSVQGNILLGPIITDTMNTTFLNTQGPLADRLMATLQAAKIIGADTRCAPRGTSSRSGFIKVVRIGDGDTPYLQIIVPDTPSGTDPIDVIQDAFDSWKDSLFTFVDPFLSIFSTTPDTLPADGTSQSLIKIFPKNNSDTLLASGMHIILSQTGAGNLSPVTDLLDGSYQAFITAPTVTGTDTISAMVISDTDTISIFRKGVVYYITPTSVKEKNSSAGRYYLYQNYPQPFNPTTTIKYHLSEISFVTLKVFDVLGNETATLVSEVKPNGNNEVKFDATGLPSGVYFYQLKAGGVVQTKKMILLR